MANTFTTTSTVRIPSFGDAKNVVLKQGTLVIDTPVGAAVDDIPASLFGLSKIKSCLGITNDGETAILSAAPDYTGDSLLVQGITATAVTTEDTGVYTTTVTVANGFTDLAADTYNVTLVGWL